MLCRLPCQIFIVSDKDDPDPHEEVDFFVGDSLTHRSLAALTEVPAHLDLLSRLV